MSPRTFLAIVLERCPAYPSPLPGCALSELRGECPDLAACKERLAAMSDEAIDESIRKHFLCVCRKNGCGT